MPQPGSNDDIQPNEALPSPGGWPKRAWVLAIAALVLVGAAAGWFFIFGPKAVKNSGKSSATYYDRPGYARNELGEAVGDPEAIVARATDAAVAYGGGSAIQACSVLALDDLHQTGLHLLANPLVGAIEREYFDGQGKAGLPVSTFSLPVLDVNECSYALRGSKAYARVRVYQPSYVGAAAIRSEHDRNYRPAADVNGVKVYEKLPSGDNPNLYGFMLVLDQVSAVLDLAPGTADAKQTARALLDKASKNLVAQATKPAGPTEFEYDSPTFRHRYVQSCKLTDNATMQALFGRDSSPLVREQLAGSTGVITFTSSGDETNYNYVKNSCTRQAMGGASEQRSLRIKSTAYALVKAAELDFDFGKQSDKGTATGTVVGDESYIGGSGADKSLVFRQGRLVIELVLHDSTQTFTPEQVSQKLTPTAVKMAQKLKNQ